MKFEVCLCVSDYVDPDDPDSECAFDLATTDHEGAVTCAKAELSEHLTDTELATLSLEAVFVECDSGNWSHAGAMYLITVTGPDEVVIKAEKGVGHV